MIVDYFIGVDKRDVDIDITRRQRCSCPPGATALHKIDNQGDKDPDDESSQQDLWAEFVSTLHARGRFLVRNRPLTW